MSGARASKRNHSRDIITPAPSTSGLGLACLPVSPAQLRDLWDYDNKCASLMGAPLRTCSCVENDKSGGISDAELSCIKDTIQTMWEKARVLFEIFCDPKNPDLGFRIRVKPTLPIKLTFKVEDAFYFGWCARSTSQVISPCDHLYQRSPVDLLGYMGGPVSYCNWAAGKQATAKIIRPTSSSVRFLARLECRNLSGGMELLWNYGSEQVMPIPNTWFQEQCCSVLQANKTKRQEKKTA
ncbi:Nucleolar complex protein 2-like protein [Frankliniella fusca]|uniref:Nucleolar complex protein 2-like protein n=1 Tax=Frankliniella fusca TaxID=407009 RepID=A0AAE1H2A8_9NEOP|nr:Nucleolar complex protein 2-like protein [Frankliniella fusca]KAK3918002.1 Nucleolar complex protein 2-like protein [Frankliniella fusca]